MLYLTTHSTHFIYGYMASDPHKHISLKNNSGPLRRIDLRPAMHRTSAYTTRLQPHPPPHHIGMEAVELFTMFHIPNIVQHSDVGVINNSM